MNKLNGQAEILVVDDEKSICDLIKRFLGSRGYEVTATEKAEEALQILKQRNFDLIITDLLLPEMNGLEMTRTLKARKYPAEILLISGYGTVEQAVEAIKLGAYDFLTKPIDLQKLHVTVANALQKHFLEVKVAELDKPQPIHEGFGSLVGSAASFMAAVDLANKVAQSDANLLITGDSGTGKEVFARAIHRSGPRKDGPFIAVNCGAIPENLIESELFGHEKGAFTGASVQRAGHFESADGGAIFLDEISELSHYLQVKLLRVVQEKEYTRLGSSTSKKTDCRIICATNKDLETEVKNGDFREDLFFRINIVEIKLPPLRDRASDIIPLAEYFLNKYSSRPVTLHESVAAAFKNYSWPGNVRELENVIQRALILTGGGIITTDLLPSKFLVEHGPDGNEQASFSGEMDFKQAQVKLAEDYEKDYIRTLLEKNGGNVLKSAQQAGISRQTLHRMMKKYGIHSYDFKNN